MKILFTIWALDGYSGVPMFTKDLASALNRAGHEVAIYAVWSGRVGREIAELGVPVVTDLSRIPFTPDVIHGQHQPALARAMLHLPHVPAVGVVHDATGPLDDPIASPRVVRHVAVDLRCAARLEAVPGIAGGRIKIILNSVDTERFSPRPPLPSRPRRALVFSNYAGRRTHLSPVSAACTAMGIPLDVIGATARRTTPCPERVLGNYDLVFAKARCALEAMATGCAVILCDFTGLGPMVTTRNCGELRERNFGAATLSDRLDPEAIAARIRDYDAADAAALGARIRSEAGLERTRVAWEETYREAAACGPERIAGEIEYLKALNARWRVHRLVRPAWRAVRHSQELPVIGRAVHRLQARLSGWH